MEKNSMRGMVERLMQHEAKPSAVFVSDHAQCYFMCGSALCGLKVMAMDSFGKIS